MGLSFGAVSFVSCSEGVVPAASELGRTPNSALDCVVPPPKTGVVRAPLTGLILFGGSMEPGIISAFVRSVNIMLAVRGPSRYT
ncbi:hypothetical protein BDV37DRAFT_249799 [Aspergillus pseudonomiae]|uniref:Uncharacterized protein n=1 Tax=Aspergillus pseudonomiae TaxID=1506151 RepID=A0A5N7DCR7_9EURO|nr:uncharacterized protein BDV37DRAFT_249799 [Aspergillus pseudonomiae]KAE8403548.1 hypothetical protein BDV37DRAFT_249799 [Aspergillus pseudonomiae]